MIGLDANAEGLRETLNILSGFQREPRFVAVMPSQFRPRSKARLLNA